MTNTGSVTLTNVAVTNSFFGPLALPDSYNGELAPGASYSWTVSCRPPPPEPFTTTTSAAGTTRLQLHRHQRDELPDQRLGAGSVEDRGDLLHAHVELVAVEERQ